MAQKTLETRYLVEWTYCYHSYALLLACLYFTILIPAPVDSLSPKADALNGGEDCQCHNHSSSCEKQVCLNCSHHTTGDECQLCIDGYYGDPTKGTPDDCKKCPCSTISSNGSCILDENSKLPACFCKQGYTGRLCEQCAANHFSSVNQTCVQCNCNHFEAKTIEGGVCNKTTGVCFSCFYNTSGEKCQECKPGHYGYSKHGCKPCFCNHNEHPSKGLICNPDNGHCTFCSDNTTGHHCQNCADGYQGDAIVAKNCTNTKLATDSNINTYIAVGTVIGVFLICAIVFACCYYRRNRRSQLLKFYTIQMYDDETDEQTNFDIALMDPSTGVEMTSDMIDTTPLTKGLLELQEVDEYDSYAGIDDVDDESFVG